MFSYSFYHLQARHESMYNAVFNEWPQVALCAKRCNCKRKWSLHLWAQMRESNWPETCRVRDCFCVWSMCQPTKMSTVSCEKITSILTCIEVEVRKASLWLNSWTRWENVAGDEWSHDHIGHFSSLFLLMSTNCGRNREKEEKKSVSLAKNALFYNPSWIMHYQWLIILTLKLVLKTWG